jgi:uncharacterized membrane protein
VLSLKWLPESISGGVTIIRSNPASIVFYLMYSASVVYFIKQKGKKKANPSVSFFEV